MTDLLAIGGAHVDRTARMIEPHIMGASNPVRFTEVVGGGAFNALRLARLRGVQNCAMMSVRGGDAAGIQVEAEAERLSIADFSGSFIDRATPSYTAIVDVDGNLITALADMDLYEKGFDRQVRRQEGRDRITAAKSILVDANLPQSAIERVCGLASGPIFAMAISPAKVRRLVSSAALFNTVFLNCREVHALGGDLAALSFKRAVVSDGKNHVRIIEGGKTISINVPQVMTIADVTGAGDALAGGTIAAMLLDPSKTIKECVFGGIASAQLALQINGPLSRDTDMVQMSTMLARVFDANRD